MKALVLLVALLLQPGFALAHGDDKPKHGGIMGRGDDTVTVEFVYEKGIMTVYVEDHDSATPIPAEKLKGAWLSVQGTGRLAQQAKLIPAGENKLTASGLGPRVGDRLSARLILPNGMETWSIVTFREASSRR
jgi:hypothetical protein